MEWRTSTKIFLSYQTPPPIRPTSSIEGDQPRGGATTSVDFRRFTPPFGDLRVWLCSFPWRPRSRVFGYLPISDEFDSNLVNRSLNRFSIGFLCYLLRRRVLGVLVSPSSPGGLDSTCFEPRRREMDVGMLWRETSVLWRNPLTSPKSNKFARKPKTPRRSEFETAAKMAQHEKTNSNCQSEMSQDGEATSDRA